MTAHVQTVNIMGVEPDEIEVESYDTHAAARLGAAGALWAKGDSLEEQLDQLAKVGLAIREQALSALTELINARSVAELAEQTP